MQAYVDEFMAEGYSVVQFIDQLHSRVVDDEQARVDYVTPSPMDHLHMTTEAAVALPPCTWVVYETKLMTVGYLGPSTSLIVYLLLILLMPIHD